MRIQDEQRTRQMIEDLIGKPFEEIIGRLNVLNAHVSRVESNTGSNKWYNLGGADYWGKVQLRQ